ncbi:hypothetical protein F5Y05DRAFT_93880 [Hypoxylon sp. FL0543]|nr:hypothetical protein F5Y05DRAFT_93880 [Hypoxylon sp. FL0543]
MVIKVHPGAVISTYTTCNIHCISRLVIIMCDFTKNYYIYTSCLDPGAHFFRTSMDGSKKHACPRGPHERYIVQPGQCPLCG